MDATLTLSGETLGTAGVILLTLVAVEWGGLFVLRLVRGRRPATPFQIAFARAGHAHAGVLLTLALVALILADAVEMGRFQTLLARNGIWAAAVLMPAGFFLSSAGRDRNEPNRLILLVYGGALSLALGVVALGLGLIRA